MKRKSWLVLMALVMAFGTLLAACGSGSSNTGTSGESGDGTTAAAQDLHINMSAEPPTFDPAQAKDSQTNTALRLMYEGLTRPGTDGNPVPGVAEKWDVSEDGLKYTFHLRDNAQWSNGEPVTAKDFAYAWERVLSPKTTPASEYAYQLYYIKNGQEFNEGKVKDFADVGVKVVDDKTLEVTLANPTSYWLGLTSFYTYYPVNQKNVEANPQWASKADTMITNGAFNLTTWTTGQELAWTKNAKYWDASSIKLNTITSSLVNSGATEFSSYQSGQLDYAGAPTGEIPTDQIPAAKQQYPDQFQAKGIASTYYYLFNVKEKPFNNLKIRQAFSMAINRQAIVDNVTLGGQIPAYGYVPPGIKGNNEEFRTEYKDSYFTEDAAKAKQLLAEGMKEEGYTTLPEITLIYNSSEAHQKIALAIADMWKNNLGVSVKTQNQEWSVFLDNRQSGNYQIARAGWTADYNDPMTFLDMWMTGNGNNDAKYSNPEYDKLLKDAQATQDNAKRMDDMSKAEKILVQDDMAMMPIYYYTSVSLVKPNLKGIFVDFSGAIDFTRAYFQ
ncbi:peptide ABC transporter substrate-binding protein [Paenibacillus sp. PsM32]|uniref:Peptide ABC transporter substrate-binding protein n=1 Tax=Paenibacillus kyungheensis TaxID=1452732 RepID=A0AAX3LZ47_9BACL|nr:MULTISPECIES: peptide ABC transporter substrate-binding protein [Paenibacillus]MDN4620531.1 peptide ABC transporter substrate-binding protein [Paenibacillus sp. PsM32]MDQ1235020.1 oligopeptide transport system substrate-binding protein [Paenibacillus sp. SORGH_AS_0306]MDR6112068.1 oligopeptide transport system substrate-binding protein [Paenibacillus sp. SORGH_AS_0338]WCT54591.1 peptide ABC transporter substrate-binding protein [Paenibacillus kyungheensis]WDF52265.1 peptide ABC transporter 